MLSEFQTMLSWVNNGKSEEEEVGQRILTALKQVHVHSLPV